MSFSVSIFHPKNYDDANDDWDDDTDDVDAGEHHKPDEDGSQLIMKSW